MSKLKLYLDTSVISNLHDTDEFRLAETTVLWEEIKAGKYEIYLSDVVFKEIDKCQQPKQDIMYNFVNEIVFVHLRNNDIVDEIANEIIKMKILKRKHIDDCIHIEHAIHSKCDLIVSWNFKHLVNVKTVRGVRKITNLRGYKEIDIYSPSSLIHLEG